MKDLMNQLHTAKDPRGVISELNLIAKSLESRLDYHYIWIDTYQGPYPRVNTFVWDLLHVSDHRCPTVKTMVEALFTSARRPPILVKDNRAEFHAIETTIANKPTEEKIEILIEKMNDKYIDSAMIINLAAILRELC